MKRKVVAMALAAVLTMSMSMTAFAASSSTSNNSSTESSSSSSSSSGSSSASTVTKPQPVDKVVAGTAAGAAIKPAAVQVAIPAADGTVKAVTLDKVVAQKQAEVVNTVAAVATSGEQAAAQVATLLTAQASEQFTATVEALAETKGANVVVNNMGTVKTAASAKDALGNTIASAGVVKNVTSGALIMLMSINADGTIEYVEGIVDPVTGAVMGAFQGTPAVITVLVLA